MYFVCRTFTRRPLRYKFSVSWHRPRSLASSVLSPLYILIDQFFYSEDGPCCPPGCSPNMRAPSIPFITLHCKFTVQSPISSQESTLWSAIVSPGLTTSFGHAPQIHISFHSPLLPLASSTAMATFLLSMPFSLV